MSSVGKVGFRFQVKVVRVNNKPWLVRQVSRFVF